MMTPGPNGHQTSLFGNDLLQQLDPQDSLLVLATAIPWKTFELEFTRYYVQGIGRPSKPIRLLVGLLILKQLENLSDEQVVLAFKRNPYYQAFCWLTEFSLKLPWTSYLPSVSRCTARRHSKARSTSTPRFRKKHHLPDRWQTGDQDHQLITEACKISRNCTSEHLCQRN